MGDGIAGHISKGPVHTKVDAYVNHKNASGAFVSRAGFLDKLINDAGTWMQYLQILRTDVGLTQAEVNYLAEVWYDPASNTLAWPQLAPMYPPLRAGLIKALQEAGSSLILDSYWMPVVAGPPLFGVVVSKSSVQVTRIILTPPSQVPATIRTEPAPMWVVTRQADPPVSTGHQTTDGVVEAVEGGGQDTVVRWRRRELRLTPAVPPDK